MPATLTRPSKSSELLGGSAKALILHVLHTVPRRLGLNELMRETQMSKSAVAAALQHLIEAGVIEADTKKLVAIAPGQEDLVERIVALDHAPDSTPIYAAALQAIAEGRVRAGAPARVSRDLDTALAMFDALHREEMQDLRLSGFAEGDDQAGAVKRGSFVPSGAGES